MNYSQNNEQEIILNLFKGRTGTFLDIGANDGITLSNTYALSLQGWKGLLVEASPKAYERLVKTYEGKDAELQNVAIGGRDCDLSFHESGELLGKGDVGLVSSAVPKPANIRIVHSLPRWPVA